MNNNFNMSSVKSESESSSISSHKIDIKRLSDENSNKKILMNIQRNTIPTNFGTQCKSFHLC